VSNPTRTILVDIELRLKKVGVHSPRFDAESLMAFSLGIERKRLGLQQEITSDQLRILESLVEKRLRRVPLQHILGEQGFRRIVLNVGPGVFIPRPETELLVESAIRYLNELTSKPKIVFDLCAGSGAIALSIACEVQNCEVIAVEKSREAFVYLEKNLQANNEKIIENNSSVKLVNADITSNLDILNSYLTKVDAIVSNPPYIPDKMIPREPEVKDFEPGMALFGGPDGLNVVREVLNISDSFLKSRGFIGIEHADVQGSSVEETGVPYLIKQTNSYSKIEDRRDLNGVSRYTVAIKN